MAKYDKAYSKYCEACGDARRANKKEKGDAGVEAAILGMINDSENFKNAYASYCSAERAEKHVTNAIDKMIEKAESVADARAAVAAAEKHQHKFVEARAKRDTLESQPGFLQKMFG